MSPVYALAQNAPESLAILLQKQSALEQSGDKAALAALNRQIAEISRKTLIDQGYRVGEIAQLPNTASVFQIPILQGPANTNLQKTITEASDRFKISYVIQVGDLHFGSYDSPTNKIQLSPRNLLLPPREMFNTILHETRHAFFWNKAARGIRSPLNIDVSPLGNQPLTDIPLYDTYFHFQEMATHHRDFQQIRAGANSAYVLEGESLPRIIETKAERTIGFAETVQKYSGLATKALKDENISLVNKPNFTFRDYKFSSYGMTLRVPVTNPGSDIPFAEVRILLPGVTKDTPDEEVRKIALDLLSESKKQGEKEQAFMSDELKAFRADPLVGRGHNSCQVMFGAIPR